MLHFTPATVSTQDDLHALAAAGATEGTAVVAAEQTVGRGSRGRKWASPPGGLWMSVLCRPATEPALEVLSLRVALAVVVGLETALPALQLGIKWPNDLMLQGRKLGGILCEARWQGGAVGWVAVGLGLNVRNPIPPDLGVQATSLAALAIEATPEQLAPGLAAVIVAASQASGPLSQEELERYRARDWLTGQPIVEPSVGIAAGISPRGELRVVDAAGTLTVHRSGTVSIAPGMGVTNVREQTRRG